jgi:hypothetical protein
VFVPSGVLGALHKRTRLCSEGTELKHKRAVTAATEDLFQQIFMLSGTPIERVTPFRYLGKQTASCDDDWHDLYLNLRKPRAKWTAISRVLIHDGANKQTSGMF